MRNPANMLSVQPLCDGGLFINMEKHSAINLKLVS